MPATAAGRVGGCGDRVMHGFNNASRIRLAPANEPLSHCDVLCDETISTQTVWLSCNSNLASIIFRNFLCLWDFRCQPTNLFHSRPAELQLEVFCRTITALQASIVPATRHSTLSDRAFPVIGARLWNSLPDDITTATSMLTFRHKLKTFLFRRSYDNVDS